MNREPKLTQGLDFYKATMGQVEHFEHPDAEVTFTLNNRAPALLSDYVAPAELRERLDELADGWQPDETAHLATLRRQDGEPMFHQGYLVSVRWARCCCPRSTITRPVSPRRDMPLICSTWKLEW